MIPSLPYEVSGVIIQTWTDDHTEYLIFWKTHGCDWEIEYHAKNTYNHMCEKRGVFQECAGCVYKDPKYDCALPNYRVPWDVVDMAVAGALEHQGNDILVWYTSEDPDILRYWVIGAIMEHAQPLVL